MKKVNIYVSGSVRWAAYKKDNEYQSWIDYAVANNLWGQPGSYTVEVVDATEELEQKRLQSEATKRLDFDSHANNTQNPHSVTKEQIGLASVDDVSASDLRDRATHTGQQSVSTLSDLTASAVPNVPAGNIVATNIQDAINDLDNRILTKYTAATTVAASTTSTTYSSVAELVTPALSVGLYRLEFAGRMQSTSANSGVGVRVAPVSSTVTTVAVKWMISQAADGTAKNFQYDQLAGNTNVTSASVAAVNTNFNVTGAGLFRITVAGTVAIQIRAETNGQTATLQADSAWVLEKVV